MASIKIDNGLKTYDIEDANGNVRGQISFNPADMNFFARATTLKDKIYSLMEDALSVKDEETSDEVVSKKLSEYDAEIKKCVNEMFDDENTSKVVFGNQNVFNLLKGETFIERFLNAFSPIITKAFQEEQKKSTERINKYKSQVVK